MLPKTIKDIPLTKQKILMRVDFNVPLTKQGTIADTTRIDATLPTIKFLLSQDCAIILMSHLGKVEGQKDPKYSLKPCADYLGKILKKPVKFVQECVGPIAENACKALQSGEILLLENLRLHSEETNPSPPYLFAKELASYAHIYVNDAFGTSHRKHSSTYYVPSFLPNTSVAGLLVEQELHYLTQCLNPEKPFSAIVGGAKISTKIGVLEALLNKVSSLFIGGAMAFTFLKAEGKATGKSLIEEEHIGTAKNILKKALDANIKIYLPLDIVYVDHFESFTQKKIYSIHEAPPSEWVGVDIGPATILEWEKPLAKSKTIFWNGPMGVFEQAEFAKGTLSLAQFLARLPATKIIGGGDSVAAIQSLHMSSAFSHLSTGGGASLELIEKGSLPAIDILTRK